MSRAGVSVTGRNITSRNYILEYWEKINTGEVIVSKKIFKQYEKLAGFIENPESNFILQYDGSKVYYEYDNKYSDRVIEFIETFCKHVKGKLAGEYIKLELWQKAMIASLYSFIGVKDKLRKYRRLHLYVARKNGKTFIAACLIIYELLAGGEKGAEAYTVATKRDQAKITWDMAKLIIKKTPALAKRFDVTIIGIFLRPFRDSLFMPLNKESKKLDGVNAHITHVDEMHAITDMNIIDVMWDSTLSRLQPIELITTTMGLERASTFDAIYDYDENVINGLITDERLLVFCYELDDLKDWQNIKMAYQANPNLGVSRSINDFHEEIEKAKNDALKLTNFLCKSLNIRQTNKINWLKWDDFNNDLVYNLSKFENSVVVGGFDLSRTNDLTAFTILLFDIEKDKIIAQTMYWATQKYIDKIKKVPMKLWVQQGYVRVSGQELINYTDIVDYVSEVINLHGWRFLYINYDSYSAAYLINDLEKLGFSREHVLKATPQGAKTLSIPMQEVEADLKIGRLMYQNNPVTKWCLSNVELEKDRNGNYMPRKGSYERKIDGVATILNCYVGYLSNKTYFKG